MLNKVRSNRAKNSLIQIIHTIRDHSSITSSKRWVGGVRKWQFLMIYSTVNHQREGWVGQKSQKHDDVVLEWSLIDYFSIILCDF